MAKKPVSEKISVPAAETDKEARKTMLDKALNDITKRYGDGAIIRMGEAHHMQVEVIPTGSLTLDLALGVGGIPRGRLTEVYGPESSGKTTLCLHMVAEAQKMGGTAAYIDMEHALDPSYAQRIGVNINNLYVSQPDTGEQALEICETLVRSGAVDIVVVDSIAALAPRAEIEGNMGDSVVGLQARLMSQALRKLSGAINQTKTAVVFTNQMRLKIGVMYGNPETTPGGLAMKYYASVRLDVRRVNTIKSGTDIVGGRVRVRVVKNKVAPPFTLTEFDLMYNEGISRTGDVLDLGAQLCVITKRGAFYSYKDVRLGQGRENAKEFLKANPAMMQEIEEEIRAMSQEGEISLLEFSGAGESDEDMMNDALEKGEDEI